MTNSILTLDHEKAVWAQARELVEAEIDLLYVHLEDPQILRGRVEALGAAFADLRKVHEECISSAYDRGEIDGEHDARWTEAKAHETVAAVVAEWMPRIKLFCQRVEKHLGSWRPDESGEVHEIRKDVHEIPRGWV